MDWKDIAQAAALELEESQRQREKMRAREDAIAEREQKRRLAAAATAKKPESPKREPTQEERKAAALEQLFTLITAGAPAETTTATHEPAPGTLAHKIRERDERQRREGDERRIAQETLKRWVGR